MATFGAITDLGFNSANIKYVSEGRNQNDCFSTYLLIKLALVGIMALTLAITVLMGHNSGKFNKEHVTVIVLFILYYLFISLQSVLVHTFNGRQENGKASVAMLIEFSVRSVLLIMFALWGANATQLSQTYIVGGIASLLASFAMLKGTGIRLVRPGLVRLYVGFALPLSISVGLIAVTGNFDKVLVGIFKDDLEVAYYSAIAGIVWGFALLGTSLNSVILPHLAKYDFKNQRESVESLLWTTEKYLFMFMLPCIAVILVAATPICALLFGEDFGISGNMLIGQIGVIALFPYIGLASQVLFSVNQATLYTKTTITNVMTTFLLFFVLIPSELFGIKMAGMGGVGASLAVSAGYVVQAIIITVAVKRVTSIGISPGVWKQFAALILSALSFYTLSMFMPLEGIIRLFLGAVFCVLVYLLVLVSLKEFGKGDIRFIRDALSPKNLYNSLNEEFDRK